MQGRQHPVSQPLEGAASRAMTEGEGSAGAPLMWAVVLNGRTRVDPPRSSKIGGKLFFMAGVPVARGGYLCQRHCARNGADPPPIVGR